MRTVILVPWRPGDELREQSWDVVQPYLERFGWKVYTGDSEGPWSRGAAINAASAKAGKWDVAVIADADTIPPQSMDAAVQLATATGGGVRPHDHLYRLTPSGSIRVARSGIGGLKEHHIETEHPGGGLLVVARKAYDAIGGFDERFNGWGHEDSYFGIQLLIHAAWERVGGSAYHLWHPSPRQRTPEYKVNRRLLRHAYLEHSRVLQKASDRLGYDVTKVL